MSASERISPNHRNLSEISGFKDSGVRYDGYDAATNATVAPRGHLVLEDTADGVRIAGTLSGLEPNVEGKVTARTGTTCVAAAGVGAQPARRRPFFRGGGGDPRV